MAQGAREAAVFAGVAAAIAALLYTYVRRGRRACAALPAEAGAAQLDDQPAPALQEAEELWATNIREYDHDEQVEAHQYVEEILPGVPMEIKAGPFWMDKKSFMIENWSDNDVTAIVLADPNPTLGAARRNKETAVGIKLNVAAKLDASGLSADANKKVAEEWRLTNQMRRHAIQEQRFVTKGKKETFLIDEAKGEFSYLIFLFDLDKAKGVCKALSDVVRIKGKHVYGLRDDMFTEANVKSGITQESAVAAALTELGWEPPSPVTKSNWCPLL